MNYCSCDFDPFLLLGLSKSATGLSYDKNKPFSADFETLISTAVFKERKLTNIHTCVTLKFVKKRNIMPTKKPRVNVTFSESEAEVLQMICKRKKISVSSLIRKVMEDWLEEYEDMLLAKRAEEADKKWEEGGKKTISHEELWKRLSM